MMKSKILKILRANEGVVSGEILSAKCGISRVSIWKHIRKLQDLGYGIISTAKGYQLKDFPDVPYPWEFPERSLKIHYYTEIPTTMDIAKSLARKDCPDFTVVIAGRQTQGRGRLQRVWLSEEGGLYFTMVLRPRIPAALSSRVSFLASVTLARTLRKMFEVDARVKWPNDILVDEHKIAGMLSEMEAEADQVAFINIGLGINVNNDPSTSEPSATSLKKILGREIPKKDLLSQYLNAFEHQMKTSKFEHVIEEWKHYTVSLNRNVRVVTHSEVFEGLAVDVDESGALLLKCADGSLKKIVYGDCFHQL